MKKFFGQVQLWLFALFATAFFCPDAQAQPVADSLTIRSLVTDAVRDTVATSSKDIVVLAVTPDQNCIQVLVEVDGISFILFDRSKAAPYSLPFPIISEQKTRAVFRTTNGRALITYQIRE